MPSCLTYVNRNSPKRNRLTILLFLILSVMDTFNFDFDTDSTLSNDTNSNQSHLDWTAFQSTTNSFSSNWLSQQDDAVAPDNRSNIVTTPYDDGIYFEIERFFSGLNQQQQELQSDIVEPIHVNIQIPDQTNYLETPPVSKFIFCYYYDDDIF